MTNPSANPASNAASSPSNLANNPSPVLAMASTGAKKSSPPLPTDQQRLASLAQAVQNHPVTAVAAALSRLSDKELAELGKTITPQVAQLYEKAFGPAILHVLSPLTHGDDGANNTAPSSTPEDIVKNNQAAMDNHDEKVGDSQPEQPGNSLAEHGGEDNNTSNKQTNKGMTAEEIASLEQEIRTLMRDPRYWRDHEPAQLAKVAQAFDKLYG